MGCRDCRRPAGRPGASGGRRACGQSSRHCSVIRYVGQGAARGGTEAVEPRATWGDAGWTELGQGASQACPWLPAVTAFALLLEGAVTGNREAIRLNVVEPDTGRR